VIAATVINVARNGFARRVPDGVELSAPDSIAALRRAISRPLASDEDKKDGTQKRPVCSRADSAVLVTLLAGFGVLLTRPASGTSLATGRLVCAAGLVGAGFSGRVFVGLFASADMLFVAGVVAAATGGSLLVGVGH
jgi:hypothetical protein